MENSTETNVTILHEPPEIRKQVENNSKPSLKSKKLIFSVIGFVSSIALLSTAYLLYKNQKLDLSKQISMITISFFSLLSAILMIFSYTLCIIVIPLCEKNGLVGLFVSRFLNESAVQLSAFLSFFITAQIINAQFPVEIINKSIESSEATQIVTKLALSNIFMGIALSISIFLLKDTILFALNFNLYVNYYNERIQQNMEKIKIIEMMNSLVNAGEEEDVDAICQRILRVISGNTDHMEYADLIKILGDENANKAMKYIDEDADKEIGFEELKGFYITTLNDREQLSTGIEQKNSSVSSLNFIFTIIVSPIALSILLSFLTNNSNFKSYAMVALTSVVGTSYIFADTIKAFFGSMVFVFFIRPFEVNDLVVINKKLFKIKEVNMMTTVMYDNMLVTITPNTSLLNTSIINLRCTKTCDKNYIFEFDAKQFKQKKQVLLKNINKYVMENKFAFKKKAVITEVMISGPNKLEAKITVGFRYENTEMKTILKNQDEFVINLSEILESTGLLPISAKH